MPCNGFELRIRLLHWIWFGACDRRVVVNPIELFGRSIVGHGSSAFAEQELMAECGWAFYVRVLHDIKYFARMLEVNVLSAPIAVDGGCYNLRNIYIVFLR